MTFSLVLAAVPFLILLLSVAGLFLAPQFEAPQSEVMIWLWRLVPVENPETREALRDVLADVVERSGSIGLFSGLAFVWFSTRLFGALRTVLEEVFDLREGPGVVKGKLTDVGLVLVSTLLLSLNVALTSYLSGLGQRAARIVEFRPNLLQTVLGIGVAFLTVYLLFLLIFKFVSLGRIRWRTASHAALFAAFSFELLKLGFGWWVSNYADYSAVFFALSTVVVLVIAVYYGSVLFVLGGEIAQVAQLRRTLRRQRERFE